MGIKKIVLITTGQPSTNPRIVKEADALSAAGFEVVVLYSHFIDWATEEDKHLLKKVIWNHKLIGGSPYQNNSKYLLTRIRFKAARLANRNFGNGRLFAERAQARAYDELLKEAIKCKADLYIGHNLGALAIAVNAATFNSAKAGFDFEDYHRGENANVQTYDLKRIIYLENKYLPQLDHISAASPMIADRVGDHFPTFRNNIITLLNYFPLSQQPLFRKKSEDDNTLQLFWFSQTIGVNRGLEIMIATMKLLNDPDIHLTLAGRCDADFTDFLENSVPELKYNIHFSGVISPDELPSFAANYDVGLALELPVPENRNICLTNKIFTYLLAGNAVILSGTIMQTAFNEENKIGNVFNLENESELTQALLKYKNKKELELQRKYNYNLAKQKLNWDLESEKLIKHISFVL